MYSSSYAAIKAGLLSLAPLKFRECPPSVSRNFFHKTSKSGVFYGLFLKNQIFLTSEAEHLFRMINSLKHNLTFIDFEINQRFTYGL